MERAILDVRGVEGALNILHNFSVFNEETGQGMHDLLEKFQNLFDIDKIDRLKQLSILHCFRKKYNTFFKNSFVI